MTLLEIRTMIKTILDDTVGTDSEQYWGSAWIDSCINEALEEIAKRTLCLKDSTTPAFCTIPFGVNKIHYAYPDRVIEIISINRSWNGRPFKRVMASDMLTSNPLWLTNTNEPHSYMTDYSTDMISFVGKFANVIDLPAMNMSVYRLPTRIVDPAAVSEVPARFHSKTINWVLYRCFKKSDSEIKDTNKANEHLLAFEGTPTQNGRGGDIRQIIMQINSTRPRVSRCRFF